MYLKLNALTSAGMAERLCLGHDLSSEFKACKISFCSRIHTILYCLGAAGLGRSVESPNIFGIKFSIRANNALVVFRLTCLYMLDVK
jgi:hypothetical protein